MRAIPAEAPPEARRLLASLAHAVVVLEPGLRISWINPAAETYFGQSQRRVSGKPLFDVVQFADSRLAKMLSDFETPVSAREVVIVHKGRGAMRVDVSVAPVADHAGWQILSIHDKTGSDALGEDSGVADNAVLRGPEIMAHEIKNPLAGIRGAAQLLARRLDDRDRPLTDLITGEVDRIAMLIERMQKLSRRTPNPVEPCNLHLAARRAIDVLQAADEEGSLRIEEEFDPSLPAVLGNADALVQVLINLLSNAQEACGGTPGGRIVLRTRFASGLQLHATDTGRSVRLPIEIRVSDSGPGVDPAMREHIFEPFVTSKSSGQGLGLPLVRKLIRDMSGRISHERDEATGWTHFRVHLPLAQETQRRSHRRRETA
ncbi:two-component system sensor histidine kinase NtrB [Novosphingobium aquimarinum]|uniref:two-component system sensor histidine kinase NtrB n=1 Tax=Novosphingobium aquimarinum TaxID=2682494 RepID=UPI0012EC9E07|nr:ATP-binding protein [Novosphingobium aquimarinum]